MATTKTNLDDTIRERHLELFFKKLEGLNISTSSLKEKYGNQLKNATYAFSNKGTMACGDGELLNTVLRVLTPTALDLSNILPTEKQPERDSIIKVCLLSQISKALMVEPNDNNWEIQNRGILYKFIEYPYALKMGMRSIAMCMECGIQLTENELEAISNLDRDDDKQTRFFSSPLSIILRQAMELAEVKLKVDEK